MNLGRNSRTWLRFNARMTPTSGAEIAIYPEQKDRPQAVSVFVILIRSGNCGDSTVTVIRFYSESNIQIVRPQKTKSQVIESQKIASSRSIVGAAS